MVNSAPGILHSHSSTEGFEITVGDAADHAP
jgi:hypothetical protein